MATVVLNSVVFISFRVAAEAVETEVVEEAVEVVVEEEEWAGLQPVLAGLVYVQAADTMSLINWECPVSNRNVQNVEVQ